MKMKTPIRKQIERRLTKGQDRKYKTKGSNYKPGNIFDKIGERIASKIIGQDPVTNEIPSQKEKRSFELCR